MPVITGVWNFFIQYESNQFATFYVLIFFPIV